MILIMAACAPSAERAADTLAAVTPASSKGAAPAEGMPAAPRSAESTASPRKSAAVPPSAEPAPALSSHGTAVTSVSLERQACFGRCPVYVVRIDRGGRVEFEGRANVRQQGTATGQVSREAFARLEAAILAAGVQSLASNYTMDARACGTYAADLPTVIMGVTIDGRTRTIRQDYGCSGAPRTLRALHRLIDSVANTGRWTGVS